MRWLCPLAFLVIVGCAPDEAPTEASEPVTERSPDSRRLIGELHDGGRRHRVAPLILHPAPMDFRVGCLVDRDHARKRGDEPRPLCFDEDRRAAPPSKLRIEYRLGLPVSESMQRLNSAGEAAHFVVEATGSLYQVLDLSHAVYRDGALRPDEIRILSGNTGGSDVLTELLRSYYGTLDIEQIEIPPVASAEAADPAPTAGSEP